MKHHYYYSKQQKGIDNKTKQFVIKKCLKYIKRNKVLDIGFVDEVWSKEILKKGCQLTIIEKNLYRTKIAKKILKNKKLVKIIRNDIEKISLKEKFDTIILGDCMQYIKRPVNLIKKLKTVLNKNGVLIITVPNRLSMHRRIGYLLSKNKNHLWLNDNEKKLGNLRAYDLKKLKNLVKKASFKKYLIDTCFLKPLSSKQIERWPDSILEALNTVGKELKEYCWFLYAICKKS